MTSVTTFACLQMLALRDALPALNCQLHVHRARMGAHFSAGRVLENLGSRDRIGQYYSASRDGHQIHPRRMTRIDSVKINPSLVMMRECAMCMLLVKNALNLLTLHIALAHTVGVDYCQLSCM